MGERSSGADRLAAALRADPPVLDDVTRARLERGLVEAAGARLSVDGTGRRRLAQRRGVAVAFGAGVVAAAATFAVVWGVSRVGEGGGETATFVRSHAGMATRTGSLHDGDVLATGRDEDLRVVVGGTRWTLGAEGFARVGRLSREALALDLERGDLRVEFHPRERGAQTLSVRTASARVEVVGTVFHVTVGRDGSTAVRVEEGVVRVVPAGAAEARLVRASEGVRVLADGRVVVPVEGSHGDAVARAVEALPRVTVEAPSGDGPQARSASAGRAVAALPGGPTLAPVEDAVSVGAAPAPGGAEGGPPTERGVAGGEPAADGAPLSDDARFDLAEALRARGAYAAARHELYAIARSSSSRLSRARAWTMVAETYARQGEAHEEAEAYLRAARHGAGTVAGHNAIFALALVRERIGNPDGARAAYEWYLRVAFDGPHGTLSRAALCRLGEAEHCGAE